MGAWAFGVLILVFLGVSSMDALLTSGLVVLQTLTGGYLWHLLRRRSEIHFLELIGMGLVLGSILALFSGVLLRPLIHSEFIPLLPSIVVMVVFLFRFIKSSPARPQSGHFTASNCFPAAAGVIAGIGVLLLNLQRYPLQWEGTWADYHVDMVFFEALSNSAARFGGTDSIFMAGADIRYHWFTYAWAGQITEITGAQPFVVLTRVLPLVALIATVSLALAWTTRLIESTHLTKARMTKFVPWLVTALIVTGGYVGAINGTILNFDSPSQALGTAWFMGFVVAIMLFIDTSREQSRWNQIFLLLIVGLTAIGITGAKVSTGALAVGALFILAILALIFRAPWTKRVWIALLVTAGAFGLTYLLFIAGSASPGDLKVLSWVSRASTVQGLNSSPANKGVLLGTIGLVLAMGARWVGGIWLVKDREWRKRPEVFFGIGLVVSGVLPVFVFSQGLNETWFALAASAPLAVLSALGVWVGWNSITLRTPSVVVLTVSSLLSLVIVSFIWTDQVWESGFGRFWGPWIAYLLAAVTGLVVAIFVRKNRIVTLLVVATTVLTLQASVARSIPIIGALLGGARDGASVSASQLADISLRENESIQIIGEVSSGESDAMSDLAKSPKPATEPTTEPTSRSETEPVTASEAVTPTAGLGWGDGELEAAEYLRVNGEAGDLVVTNDTEGFKIPALSAMQSYMTGAIYQSVYGGKATVGEIPERTELSRRFIAQPNSADLAVLCDVGVRWVWVDRLLNPESPLQDLGDVVVKNDAVAIVELNSCGG